MLVGEALLRVSRESAARSPASAGSSSRPFSVTLSRRTRRSPGSERRSTSPAASMRSTCRQTVIGSMSSERREPRLVDPLVHRDAAENLKLRGGHAEMARLLLEALSEQAGGIHEQEAERTNLCHARAYNKLAYNRQAHRCAGLTHRCEALGSGGHQTREQKNADENRQGHGCSRPKAFRIMPLVEFVLVLRTRVQQAIESIYIIDHQSDFEVVHDILHSDLKTDFYESIH